MRRPSPSRIPLPLKPAWRTVGGRTHVTLDKHESRRHTQKIFSRSRPALSEGNNTQSLWRIRVHSSSMTSAPRSLRRRNSRPEACAPRSPSQMVVDDQRGKWKASPRVDCSTQIEPGSPGERRSDLRLRMPRTRSCAGQQSRRDALPVDGARTFPRGRDATHGWVQEREALSRDLNHGREDGREAAGEIKRSYSWLVVK